MPTLRRETGQPASSELLFNGDLARYRLSVFWRETLFLSACPLEQRLRALTRKQTFVDPSQLRQNA